MAHKKAAWSAKNLRDSNPKYRGLKINGGQFARAGNIIVRQQWGKYRSWNGTYTSKDFTIHAMVDGVVTFTRKSFVRFDGRKYTRTVVHVIPEGGVVKETPAKKTPAAKEPAAKKDDKATDASSDTDDLTKIEGIGPVIAKALAENGIDSFEALSWSKVSDLREILEDADLSQHNPGTWKKQATLAKNGKRDKLKELQDELVAGK